MPTKKSLRNLKRGKRLTGTPESAARAPAAKAAKAEGRARELSKLESEIGGIVGEDPRAVYETLHVELSRQMIRLLREEERRQAKPSRETTDRLRELRQVSESLAAYREARGADLESERFLQQMSERLLAAAPFLEKVVGLASWEVPRPADVLSVDDEL